MFKYNDKVRVKSWFYEGMEGTVAKYKWWCFGNEYLVAIKSSYGALIDIESFKESDLELIK